MCAFVLCCLPVSSEVVFVFVGDDAARATWPSVVDMSLSAPAQAVRGTRTNSLDHLDFQERRQLIASSLSLTDFLHVGAKEVAAVAVAGEIPQLVDKEFNLAKYSIHPQL